MLSSHVRLYRRLFTAALILLSLLALTGCGEQAEHTANQLLIRSGAGQIGISGTSASAPLVIEVLGPPRRRASLAASRRQPAQGVKVLVEPLYPAGGAQAHPREDVTDVAGTVRCQLTFGQQDGDHYYRISCPDFESVPPLTFHIASGVNIIGGNQQTFAGDELPAPITLQVGQDNNPVVGCPVYFRLTPGLGKAKLSVTSGVTNASGQIATQLQTAEGYTGKYEIMAEIGSASKPGVYTHRAIPIQAMALSRSKLALGVLGGLALFLFGMTLMSDGLQMIAGNRLKSILQLFTGNRFMAILAGLGITALIQSSSACTVMVVGFVNAGLLNLTQAIGVIFGSAIGTTVTAQMVSFQLEALALPAICIGVCILLVAKESRSKGVARTVLGFGLLFFGMTLMSNELKAIADFPSFKAVFRYFDCTPLVAGGSMPLRPVLGAILVGTVMTMVVQSSSATVGLTIALAQSGLLDFYTAVPLILGDNIGTTITGLLASINTNRTARQAAVAATIFKTLGVMIMLLLFYVPWDGVPCFLRLVDLITAGDVFAAEPENIGRHLASAHTLFNVVNVLMFVPLVSFVAKLSRLIVPELEGPAAVESERICHLEPHLLNSPAAALDQSLTALMNMTRFALRQSHQAIGAFVNQDTSVRDELYRKETMIDKAQRDIMDYLVKLTRRNLNEEQSALIPDLLHCINDAERIGDRAINIFDLVDNLQKCEMKFSLEALQETAEIERYLQESGTMLLNGIARGDVAAIDKMIRRSGELQQMTARFEQNHDFRLRNRDCSIENGVIYVELLANIERISGHLINLAERSRMMLSHRVTFLNDSGEK